MCSSHLVKIQAVNQKSMYSLTRLFRVTLLANNFGRVWDGLMGSWKCIKPEFHFRCYGDINKPVVNIRKQALLALLTLLYFICRKFSTGEPVSRLINDYLSVNLMVGVTQTNISSRERRKLMLLEAESYKITGKSLKNKVGHLAKC